MSENKKFNYYVDDGCIGCKVCEGIAKNNFFVDSKGIASVIKQPDNEQEIVDCDDAMASCPVNIIRKKKEKSENEVILPSSKVRATIEKYPFLKEIIVDISPKFKKLENKIFWNSVARFATFKDAAKMAGVSVCEILHVLNRKLGTEDNLVKMFPECLHGSKSELIETSADVSEDMNIKKRYEISGDETNNLELLVSALEILQPGEGIEIESSFELVPLIGFASEKGFKFSSKEIHSSKYILRIENSNKRDWKERKESFEQLDVRRMKSDPFDIIIKKAYDTKPGDGFILIQSFEPTPLINMLTSMNYEYITEEKGMLEYWVYFHKLSDESNNSDTKTDDKIDVVIQSATPVAYPIIMKLLQSEKIRQHVNIKELKVWEETEKHIGWIASKRADISFSSLITIAKMRDYDVIMPSVFVWDNFVIVSRGYEVRSFEDLKGRKIFTPLFKEAPPAAITRALMKESGLNPGDFDFEYGNPFGRPEDIMASLIKGEIDTGILREPEASFTLHELEKQGVEHGVLSYNKIWNDVYENYGSFPNAGIVFKGEFARKHPEAVRLFLMELENAINWVKEHKKEAAKLSFDIMRQSTEGVELFLNRVNFDFVTGKPLQEKIAKYIEVLNKNEILNIDLNDSFLSAFKL